jgi:Recombination enhancement, RecA-dependent nuclease
MRHSTGKPTKYEQERITAMLALGCCACAQLGIWFTAECHHIVEGTRLGHWYTLPVCPGHHRKAWTSHQVEVIPPDLRVSIADGSKAFAKVYGTQRENWEKIQQRLKLPAIWPTTKRVSRSLPC